jgi:predicted cupin superfamily sugar epimerase
MGQDSRVDADDIIRDLSLEPHPEGGWYRETHRDEHSSAIFFLLRTGERSHWHRVDATEMWHFYAGAPLRLRIGSDVRVLGTDFAGGARPQLVVPADAWQSAESLGEWTLVGCTVSPPFRFEGFELAPEDFDPA